MKIKVRIIAPGCKVEPYIGAYVTFQPVTLQGHGDAFEVEASAVTNWRSPGLTADRAGVVALGVIDLVLRWPLFNVFLDIEINGQAAPRSRNISSWQPY